MHKTVFGIARAPGGFPAWPVGFHVQWGDYTWRKWKHGFCVFILKYCEKVGQYRPRKAQPGAHGVNSGNARSKPA